MHYLLAMNLRGGPWAGMYLCQIMHLSFFALMVAAVYGLARRYANTASATIAALSLLTVPWITQLAGIAYDEGGFLLFGILSIGIAMIATFESKDRRKRFALAGAFAGFAAGSKLTAVPEVLMAVPVVTALAAIWMILRGMGGSPMSSAEKTGGPPAPRGIWIGIALFCITGPLCFSPWLARNIAWAGNPVFPELMPILGHDGFSPVQVERFEKAHKPLPAQQPLIVRLTTLDREVLDWWPDGAMSAWQFGHLIIPFGLIAFGMSARKPRSWCLLGLLFILTAFWLLMTHLQSRFFILAAPIAALLIASIDWKRWAIAGVLVVMFFGAIGWWRTAERLNAKLYGSGGNTVGIVSILGTEGAWLYEQMTLGDIPKTGTIYLVGDARAFLYPVPMSRLHYRTVFDVKDTGSDVVQAWIGSEKVMSGDCLLVDPAELRRFHQTYFGLPPLPAGVEQAPAPYIVRK
jgi:hypothetical protein